MTMAETLPYRHMLAGVAIQMTAHPAVRRAVNVATKTDGGVSLLHVLEEPTSTGAAADNDAVARRHLQQLQETLPLIRDFRLVTGRRWSSIVDVADELGVDLIVIGSFVRGQLAALLGETSDRVLHDSGRDVLVVRSDRYTQEQPPTDYRHVIAAVDRTAEDGIVGRRAVALAELYGARLTLIHILERFPVDRENEAITPENRDPMEYQKELRMRYLDGLAQTIGCPEAEREVIATNRTAGQGIPEAAATREADLIVVGSHRNYGLDVLLGNTADGIVHRAPCDVLVVHAEG